MAKQVLDVDKLYRTYSHKLKRYLAYRFDGCLTQQDVEDVLQVAFMKVWESRHVFRGECKPETWVTIIATRHVIDVYIKSREIADKWAPYTHRNEHVDWVPAADLRVTYDITKKRLIPRHQTLLGAVVEDDYNSSDLASLLNTTANGAKTSLYRARQSFKRYAKIEDCQLSG